MSGISGNHGVISPKFNRCEDQIYGYDCSMVVQRLWLQWPEWGIECGPRWRVKGGGCYRRWHKRTPPQFNYNRKLYTDPWVPSYLHQSLTSLSLAVVSHVNGTNIAGDRRLVSLGIMGLYSFNLTEMKIRPTVINVPSGSGYRHLNGR